MCRLLVPVTAYALLAAAPPARANFTPVTPSLPVVVNAVLDALRPLGVTDIAMPATPYAIWKAIQEAKAVTPPSP